MCHFIRRQIAFEYLSVIGVINGGRVQGVPPYHLREVNKINVVYVKCLINKRQVKNAENDKKEYGCFALIQAEEIAHRCPELA